MRSSRARIQQAIQHLRDLGILLEGGLAGGEIAAVETALRFRFPQQMRHFLQAALPVTAGFTNWRWDEAGDLRRLLDRPRDGVLFDVRHNRLWLPAWGPQPATAEAALAAVRRWLTEAPTLVPLQDDLYLPAGLPGDACPVLSIRQSDVRIVAGNLWDFLLDFGPAARRTEPGEGLEVPFWGGLARHRQFGVPFLGRGVRASAEAECRQIAHFALSHGIRAQTGTGGLWSCPRWPAVWFYPHEELQPEAKPRPGFGLFLCDAGWLVNGCPDLYFLPDPGRVEERCRALFHQWLAPAAGTPARLPLQLNDTLRSEFGLIFLDPVQFMDEGWRARDRHLEGLGWRKLAGKQHDEAWEKYERWYSRPDGSFRTPTPSVNWDISPIYLRTREEFTRLDEDLTLKALAALRRCTLPGEELYALDWNHPCYFFDPHGGVADAARESWAIPILPNGDSYTFLARDFRFGIIGDCAEQTMCVFGEPLLAAFAEAQPELFRKKAWTVEEREAMRAGWADLGWRRLTCDERDEYRDNFFAAYDFAIQTPGERPCFREPAPSVTWDISSLLRPGQGRLGPQEAGLTLHALAAFQRATPPGEDLLALDGLRFYEHYAFDPHRLTTPGRDQWAHPIVPDDDFTIFVARDYRFGLVGNPVEKTLCVFGRPLLDAFLADLPVGLGPAVRQNGLPVDLDPDRVQPRGRS